MILETFVRLVHHIWHAGTCVHCGASLPEGHAVYDRGHGTDWCHACYDTASAAAEMSGRDEVDE